jgi:hypothetical protein
VQDTLHYDVLYVLKASVPRPPRHECRSVCVPLPLGRSSDGLPKGWEYRWVMECPFEQSNTLSTGETMAAFQLSAFAFKGSKSRRRLVHLLGPNLRVQVVLEESAFQALASETQNMLVKWDGVNAIISTSSSSPMHLAGYNVSSWWLLSEEALDVEGLDYEFGNRVAKRFKGGHGRRRRSKCRGGSAFLAPGETRRDPCRLQELVLVPLVLSNIFASHGWGRDGNEYERLILQEKVMRFTFLNSIVRTASNYSFFVFLFCWFAPC